MSLWKFTHESAEVAAGSNTVAGELKGSQPPVAAGMGTAGAGWGHAEKRNVIVTSAGWVRRENRSSQYGTTRKIEQVIVAANPGYNRDYSSNTFMQYPDISQIYVKLNANGYISANATNVNLYVVFNTPINWKASGNLCSITIANTAAGNNAVARFANTLIQNRIVNANNTLVFRLPKLQANNAGSGASFGTYKVQAQSISVTGGGNPLYNPEKGTTYAANLVISGAVSNALSTTDGSFVTTFRVRLRG